VSRPEDIPASLDRLLALHSERAEFKYATRHRDLFAQASHRAFIADVAQIMAERDQLRIFELEVDGKIVAARMAFLLGEELYLYYSGYDLAWRKHSIMTTLMCECFKWAIERGVKVVAPCRRHQEGVVKHGGILDPWNDHELSLASKHDRPLARTA